VGTTSTREIPITQELKEVDIRWFVILSELYWGYGFICSGACVYHIGYGSITLVYRLRMQLNTVITHQSFFASGIIKLLVFYAFHCPGDVRYNFMGWIGDTCRGRPTDQHDDPI
jgi:hypothetical protein